MAPVGQAICCSLRRGSSEAPPTWAALKQETAHLRAAVVACHPLIASSHMPLAQLLPQLPKCIGLHAVRSRVKHSGNDILLQPPELYVDLASRAVVLELPALLPALTHVRSLVLGWGQSMRAMWHPKWAALLESVSLHMPWLHGLAVKPVAEQSGALQHIAALTQLRALRISCEALPDSALGAELPPLLASLTGLQDLRLCHAGVRSLDTHAAAGFGEPSPGAPDPGVAALGGLTALRSLTCLVLSAWLFAADEMTRLAAALPCLPSLVALDLSFMKEAALRREPAQMYERQMAVSRAIASCTTLTLLALKAWHNDLAMQVGHAGPHPLAHAVAGLPHLARLNVDNDLVEVYDIDGTADWSGARADVLAALAACAPRLRFLDVSNFGAFLSREAAEAAGRRLGAASGLGSLVVHDYKTLTAGHQGMCTAVARGRHGFFVAAAAPQLPQLRQLQLGGIGLEGDGMVAFAAALTHLSSLTMLVMPSSHCGCERGTDALAAALRDMTQLQLLDVSGNSSNKVRCKDACAAALAAAVPHITALRVLSIGGLRLRGGHGALFMHASAQLSRLATLQFRGNELGCGAAAYVQACEACLPEMLALKLFSPERAGLPASTLARIRDAWARCDGGGEVRMVGENMMRGGVTDADWELMSAESVFTSRATPDSV